MGAVKKLIEDATYNVMKTFVIEDDDEGNNYSKVFQWIMTHANLCGNVLDQFYHANICPQCISLTWGDPCCIKKERL